jgi:tartrate-resistant acid phosphatase type 5
MRQIIGIVLFLTAACASAPQTQTALSKSRKPLGCNPPPCATGPQPCISIDNQNCAGYNPPPPDAPCTDCNCEAGLYCMENCGALPAKPASSWNCTPSSDTPCGLTAPRAPGAVHFAVIGDWGDTVCAKTCSSTVADMVKLWDKKYGIDFIITTGDNNYPVGAAADLESQMALYAKWSPWHAHTDPGTCPPPAPPRFFPTLGNHDTYTGGPTDFPYLAYFCQFADPAYSPTGTARYYRYAPNDLMEIFSINSNGISAEPDGNTMGSIQQQWIANAMATSSATWKLVIFHEPPQISTSQTDRASDNSLLWDFRGMGASIVLMGHQHLYERIVDDDGLTWVVNGLGGTTGIASIRNDQGCEKYIAPGSRSRFNESVGAMIGVATADELRFCFLAANRENPEGTCIDSFPIAATRRAPLTPAAASINSPPATRAAVLP